MRVLTREKLSVFTALMLLILIVPVSVSARSLPESVREDTEWFGSYPNRFVGTTSHAEAVQGLLERIQAVPDIEVWTQQFPLVTPQVQRASLEIDSGRYAGTHRVYPVWPSSARLNSTTEEGLSGRLIYVGKCNPEEIPANSLKGQIAVAEASCAEAWVDAYNAGARGILLLGSPSFTYKDIDSHLLRIPIEVPRFFIPDGPFADSLRTGEDVSGKVLARCTWTTSTAKNIYALVMPESQEEPQQAIAVGVPIDSISVVPELSPGADVAIDAAFGLNLLRHFAQDRPVRPVMFVFADGFAFHQKGVREMLSSLSVKPKDRKKFIKEDEEIHEEYLEHEQLASEVAASEAPLEIVGNEEYKDLHRYIKDEVAKRVIAIERHLHPLRLATYKASGEREKILKKKVLEYAEQLTVLYSAQKQLITRSSVQPTTRALAEDIWKETRERSANQLKEIEAELVVFKKKDQLRLDILKALGLPQDEDTLPLSFFLGIDISHGGIEVGPQFNCRYLGMNETGNARDFRTWLNGIDKQERDQVWPGQLDKFVNLQPIMGLDSTDSYFIGETVNVTSPAQSFGLASITWASLEGFNWYIDTPNDTVENLNWERIDPQIEATTALLERLLMQDDFQQRASVIPNWTRARGTIVDQSSGEPVPRVPMAGYLATLVNGWASSGNAGIYGLPIGPGVRRQMFTFTGSDGRFTFEDMPGVVSAGAGRFFVQAYLLGDNGEMRRAVDMAQSGKGVNLNIDTRSRSAGPLRAVAFYCDTLTSLGFFDSRFLLPLPAGTLMDAERGGVPQRAYFSLYRGNACAHLEPGKKWQMILRVGTTRNRMALLNMTLPKEGEEVSTREAMKGFEIGERLPSTPIHVAANDIYILDEKRLRDYKKAGISSQAIDELRIRSEVLLREADLAIEADDGSLLYSSATGALANEIRAYQAVRDTANDIVRAAIFLLLALIPFSYAFERLIFASAHVYKQIAGIAVIFTIMTGILWSFHPAFRMSSQPMMIIMAFGIIFMSLLVIAMIYSKFENGLEEMRTGRTEGSGASMSRSGVLTSAISLGIANMRNRKFRTAITGATIILITFVLLCFTSTSSYVGQKTRQLNVQPPFSGVMLRQPSTRPMPEETVRYLETVVDDSFPVAPRYWWCNPYNPQWRIHVKHPVTHAQISLQAAVGLTPQEGRLTRVREVLPDWDRFATDGGCYLGKEIAEQIEVSPGDTILVAGEELVLRGIFDSSEFDDQIADMDGQSFLPVDYSSLGGDQRNLSTSLDINLIESEMETGSGLEPEIELAHLSSNSVIVVPAELLRGMRDTSLRSVAVGTETFEQAEKVAEELVQRLAFPIFFSTSEGVRAFAATVLLPQGPKSLFVPLFIGGLIILNTMLGSIAERKRDIYIYTSMGLAPIHVGVLFLAEAMTYGLMGSIFGYVVGQGVATVFMKFGLMGGITLNYSGTHAVMTMVMVMAVVVISSLLPAYLAGKMAVPSMKMSWRVPDPVDDVISDTLPFTVTENTANGVMMFLYEYLEAHCDGAIGNFTTDDLKPFLIQAEGQKLLGLKAVVWLVPYDLGIRQDMTISVRPTGEEDICELDLELRRGSGQVGSWHNLNKVFLADLRRQLLGWRKLKLERMLGYITGSKKLLEETEDASSMEQ